MKNQISKIKPQKFSYFLSLFLLFAFCFLVCNKASAAGLSLGVYPPVIQIDATPPATVSHQISVVNNSDQPVTLKIFLKPFENSDKENGDVLYPDQKDFFTTQTNGFLTHVQLLNDAKEKTDEISLSPRQQKSLLLSIDIPQGESSSDYYFSIFFVTSSGTIDQANESILAGGIAMNVLVTIGPKDPPSGYIKTFSAPMFLQKGPVPFNVEIANTSSHYLTPKGIIIIKNMYGQAIGKVDLLPVTVLSHRNRFIPDVKTVSDTTAIWPEKFLIGGYTAELTIALSDQGPVLKKTTHFFSLPIETIITSIVLLIILVFIIIRVRKRLK